MLTKKRKKQEEPTVVITTEVREMLLSRTTESLLNSPQCGLFLETNAEKAIEKKEWI